MTAQEYHYLHTSPGAQFIFFSRILYKLYIKPCSSNSFRFLTFKLCLAFAAYFLSIFFSSFFIHSSFFLYDLASLCAHPLQTHTHTYSTFPTQPFVSTHASLFSVMKELIPKLLSPWMYRKPGGGGRGEMSVYVPSLPERHCISGRLGLI